MMWARASRVGSLSRMRDSFSSLIQKVCINSTAEHTGRTASQSSQKTQPNQKMMTKKHEFRFCNDQKRTPSTDLCKCIKIRFGFCVLAKKNKLYVLANISYCKEYHLYLYVIQSQPSGATLRQLGEQGRSNGRQKRFRGQVQPCVEGIVAHNSSVQPYAFHSPNARLLGERPTAIYRSRALL